MTTQSQEDRFQDELRERGLLEHVSGVCQESGLTLGELLSSRSPPAPAVRARVFLWLKTTKGWRASRIGRLFGKPHSGVLYALQSLERVDAKHLSDGGRDER